MKGCETQIGLIQQSTSEIGIVKRKALKTPFCQHRTMERQSGKIAICQPIRRNVHEFTRLAMYSHFTSSPSRTDRTSSSESAVLGWLDWATKSRGLCPAFAQQSCLPHIDDYHR